MTALAISLPLRVPLLVPYDAACTTLGHVAELFKTNPAMYTTPSGFSSHFVRTKSDLITTLMSSCRWYLGKQCVPADPEKVEAGCKLVREQLSLNGTYGSIRSMCKVCQAAGAALRRTLLARPTRHGALPPPRARVRPIPPLSQYKLDRYRVAAARPQPFPCFKDAPSTHQAATPARSLPRVPRQT